MLLCCLQFLSSVCRDFSLTATYLHYVVDQRVAEHPVQVDALILQDVLEKQKQIKNEMSEDFHRQEKKV